MTVFNYINSIPAYNYISIYDYMQFFPIGCQVDIPNAEMSSAAGIIVYYANRNNGIIERN